jgi:2,4-dichlorophenol 6-monooxygenase
MSNETLDLLITGAGPAGLLASCIASQLGLTHRVIEQRPGLHTEPSAHVLKTHTMELYRRIGAADRISALGTPVELQRCIAWCETIGGLTYGRLDLTGKKGRVARFTDISPVHSENLPQSLLEPLLHARAKELAGGVDPVSFDTAFQSYRDDGEGVTATVLAHGNEEQIQARYLIGADGAASRVRRAAGIAMEGPQLIAQFLAIHIKSDMRPFLARNPGVVFFIRSVGREGFFIMHQPVGSQVFMMRYDPAVTPFDSFDTASCRAIMDEVMGAPHNYELAAIDTWAMSAQIAARYREGRVFLIGDAGHRFPPTGGLGLNTGVEDVENLMWKLGAVLRGQAADALLDSYELECRPIAIRNSQQSVSNHSRTKEVERALGVEEGDDGFQAAIDEMAASPSHPRHAAAQSAIDAQIRHFAFLELEMAAVAKSGVFINAGRVVPLPVPSEEGYQPCFLPGHHVPHLWIEPDISTIDCLSFDRFTLFVPTGSAEKWEAAIAALPPGVMGIALVPLDESASSARASASDYWGRAPFAVLVRPDGRIAWVEPDNMKNAQTELADTLASLLSGTVTNTVEAV